ncbi:MAG: CoA transferase [Steroidobacteraceae bacterium]|nr:CoA transferase [Steroidobacteraceae bacterium]MDW8260725.1 CoA transferase [Gammaproteobacteria bacterium]
MLAAFAWADSGLMALTGPADAAPLVPAFDLIGAVARLCRSVRERAAGFGSGCGASPSILTERAALLRLRRGGQISCNASCRLLEARDGWLAVNLPRPTDWESIAAWLGCRIRGHGDWQTVAAAVRLGTVADLTERAQLLSLAVGRHADRAPLRRPEAVSSCAPDANGNTVVARHGRRPLVIDLSALWAGPLCSALLRECGARVVRVEDRKRLDGSRIRSNAFFARLNAGKESVVLDFDSDRHRRALRTAIDRADIVISSARPRALDQLGLTPEVFLQRNPDLIWIAITAYGWRDVGEHRVGFGDDVAVQAGLTAMQSDGRPVFVGDAIADPLAGLQAARCAFSAWSSGRGGLYDISLFATADCAARGAPLSEFERGVVVRRRNGWWLRVGSRARRVTLPKPPPYVERVRSLGADTTKFVAQFGAWRSMA